MIVNFGGGSKLKPQDVLEIVANAGYLTEEADPGYVNSPVAGITSTDIQNWNNKSDFSGDYNSLANKPELFDGDYSSLSNKPELFDGDYSSLSNKPELFDGDYNSLENKPTIPEAYDDSELQASMTQVNNAMNNIELVNAADVEVMDANNYYTKEEVRQLFANIGYTV